MHEEAIKKIIEALNLKETIELEHIPNIDLYMDQVITLFEEKLQHTKRCQEDKLLTKTMINNYTKDKLLMPAVKKKYSKQHIILMILLYQMKNVLSMGDIKSLFSTFTEAENADNTKLVDMYHIYLQSKTRGVQAFEEEVSCIIRSLNQQIDDMQTEKDIDIEGLTNLLLPILLIEQANYYKRLAEKLIDETIKA